MCASSKNISDGAARLGTSLFTNRSGIHWGTGPIYHPYCPVLRHTLAHRQLSLDSDTLFNQRCYLKGAFKGCVFPPATKAGLYSPLSHWRRPQAQNASQPTTTLDSPSRDFRFLSDNWEWGCFHGSGKIIDKNANIYWTTWHTEPELPWQVRLIHKLNSN